MRVWSRACDFLGLMKDLAICSSILGPSQSSLGTPQKIGNINWSEGATKMTTHIPLYILGEQKVNDILLPSLCAIHVSLQTLLFENTIGVDFFYFVSHIPVLFPIFPARGFTCTTGVWCSRNKLV